MINIIEIANKIKNNGGNVYLVGGAVRDLLLNCDANDKDYCVTGITSENFLKLFPNAKIRGKSFEVFDIENTEFAMARIEAKTDKGHTGFEIKTGIEIDIIQDLERRDITINSMAIDVLTNKLIDPYNGKKDLENKVIKATTEKFKEDPLRVYRVARFASLLQFDVDKKTLKLMNNLKEELNTLSAERIFTEFKKSLASKKPSIFFEILIKADLLECHFKEIFDLIGALQPEKYHPEGDAYNHTMMSLDKSVEYTDNLEVRFACLVHDLGKGITPKEEYPHHYGHDRKGVELVRNLCNRLKMPTSWKKCGIVATSEHMRAGIFWKLRPGKKVELIEKISKTILGIDGMEIVVKCDKMRTENDLENTIEFSKISKAMLKEIDGKYIKEKHNINEGRKFSEILHKERIKWILNY